MRQHLKVSEVPNLKEACGILRWFLSLKPTASTEQLNCCMEVLRWVVRHNLHDKFHEKVQLVTSSINAALTRCLDLARKQGCKPTEFLKLHSSEVAMLLPSAELEKVLSHTGEWLEVEPQLQVLVSSCGLGMQLFGFAIKETLGAMVCQKLEKHLDELIKSKTITPELVRTTSKAMLTAVKEISNVDALPVRRSIQAIRWVKSWGL